MDNGDSKRRNEVALYGVDECEVVKGPYKQGSDDDFALLVKQFRRAFMNKENDGKWSGESTTKHKNWYTKENLQRYTGKGGKIC